MICMIEKLDVPPKITLVGMAKAGKSELANHLVHDYGYRYLRPSDVIRKRLREIHGDREFDRNEYRLMGEVMRREHGALFYIDDSVIGNDERILVDGPRHLDSFRGLISRGFLPVGIVAKPEVRFARAIDNSDKIGAATLSLFMTEEAPEMNSNSNFGGHLLPILWSIPSQDIIDTSALTVEESMRQISDIFRRYSSPES